MLKDRHPEAVVAADRALVLAADHRIETTVEALITKGTSLGVIGRNVEAEATLRGAIHLADRLGLIQAALRARNNLSGPIGFADLTESEHLMRDGYEMASRYGHRPFLYQFLMVLLQAAFRRGAWDEWLPEMRAIRENESLPLFYDSGLLGVEAQLTAILGDLAGGRRLLDQATELRTQLQSDQAEAYLELMRGYLAAIEGSWPEAASLLLVGAANSNFVEEGSYLSAVAAAAGNLPDALDAAIEVLSHPLSPGRTSDAMLAAATAARAARQGRWDEARAGFAQARGELTAAGELLYANLAGLLWEALAGARQPEAAAAGSEAEAFFTERGADAFVRQFRDRFVEAATAPATPGEHPPAGSREAVPAGDG
jgi:hypothetical protein